MATINDIVYKYGGEYRRGVFVQVQHTAGGGAWERVLLRNDLPANRPPDYVRVQYPVLNDEGQASVAASFDARAGTIIGVDGIDWDVEDDGTDLNSIALWITDNEILQSAQWIFVEYGVEHSVTK